MRTLVWFRSDLRVDDNPALTAAVQHASEGVGALFIVCLEQWRSHDWGEAKIDFVLRSAAELSRQLDKLAIPLIVCQVPRFGDVPRLLSHLTDRLGCDAVFANREYEVNERRRDEAVGRVLDAAGCTVHWCHDQLVVPPGRLRTGAGRPYSVFSPFRRAWERYVETEGIPALRAAPGRVSKLLEVEASSMSVDLGDPSVRRDEKIAQLWPAGEAEAHKRLERFAQNRISSYEDQRNIAGLDATSRLSPYLAVGSLSARRCLEVALAANSGRLSGGEPGVETWIGELVWRDFYRHVVSGFPRVSKGRAFRLETERVQWRDSEDDFAAWSEGRTGVPYVDAGMRELAATGWMHNRLRMVTAQFLTKDLLIDWRLGERFFMNHLVDADLASNNGGWQWSASTGTDAAPYFRIFNPWTQGKKYDPDATYIKKWIVELRDVSAADLHDPDRLAPHLEQIDYPRPLVNHKAARIRALNAFERIKSVGAGAA